MPDYSLNPMANSDDSGFFRALNERNHAEAIGRLTAENERLRAALNRLQAAYNNREISGSLWDTEQHCYISLPVFFASIAVDQETP